MATRVIANLVIGADGCTTLDGRSRGLSSAEDRTRFHTHRSQADLLLIGANTARHEPYRSTPLPLVVVTHGQMPEEVCANPRAHVRSGDLSQIIHELDGVVLIEAGPQLLKEALKQQLVDEVFITQTNVVSGENCIDINSFFSGYKESAREEIGEEVFFTFVRALA